MFKEKTKSEQINKQSCFYVQKKKRAGNAFCLRISFIPYKANFQLLLCFLYKVVCAASERIKIAFNAISQRFSQASNGLIAQVQESSKLSTLDINRSLEDLKKYKNIESKKNNQAKYRTKRKTQRAKQAKQKEKKREKQKESKQQEDQHLL